MVKLFRPEAKGQNHSDQQGEGWVHARGAGLFTRERGYGTCNHLHNQNLKNIRIIQTNDVYRRRKTILEVKSEVTKPRNNGIQDKR